MVSTTALPHCTGLCGFHRKIWVRLYGGTFRKRTVRDRSAPTDGDSFAATATPPTRALCPERQCPRGGSGHVLPEHHSKRWDDIAHTPPPPGAPANTRIE